MPSSRRTKSYELYWQGNSIFSKNDQKNKLTLKKKTAKQSNFHVTRSILENLSRTRWTQAHATMKNLAHLHEVAVDLLEDVQVHMAGIRSLMH